MLPLGESWLISDNDTSETVVPSVDELGKPFLISYEVSLKHFIFYTRI